MSVYNNQEQEIPSINHPLPSPEQQEEELLLLQQTAVTTLDSSADDPTAANNRHPCTNCGFPAVSPASHKRPAPDPSTASARAREQPKQKKPYNNHPFLHGFSKIPLPTQDQPVLRRCSSDLYSSLASNTSTQVSVDPQSPPQNADTAGPETPLSAARASAAKLPPRVPPLRRSVSDPNPSPSKTFSSSCVMAGGYDSPNDKRLKKMRDCIRELNKWWDEMQPEEDDNGIAEVNNNNATMGNSEADIEESVSVERAGECLIIHFKCPCGKGYQILLSGRNCYYKLM